MARGTATFQQKELRDKLRRLEEEITRAKAAAEEASRRAEQRRATVAEAVPAPAAGKPATEGKSKA
jgi:hypothetical protein